MSAVIDDSQALGRVVLMDEFGEFLEQARLPAKRWDFKELGLELEVLGKQMPESVYLGSCLS